MTRRALRLVLPLLAALLPAATVRAEDPADARGRFLRDGDAAALARALASEAGEPGRTDAVLARMAAEPALAGATPGPDGYGALPAVVAALRRLDLAAAEREQQRAERSAPSRPVAWAAALLEARRGRDAKAVERLVAAGELAEDRFRVAVFAAALPEDDRLLLAAVGRRALLDAAARGAAGTSALARDLVGVDRTCGAEALAIAARLHRRSGRDAEAAALLDGAEAARVGASADLLLERGARDLVRGAARTGLAGAAFEPWHQPVAQALAGGGAVDLAIPSPPAGRHAEGTARLAFLVARVATLAGTPTSPDEVLGEVVASETSPATSARRALEGRGLATAWLAGDPRAMTALLEAGLPALLFRPEGPPERVVDEPVLVRGAVRSTGLLVLDECDASRADVLPPAALAKGRLLVAAPRAAADRLARWKGTIAYRLGEVLAQAEEEAEAGRPREAADRLEAARATMEGIPPFDLYRGVDWFRAAVAADPWDGPSVSRAREAMEKSLSSGPPLAIEHHVRGRGLAFELGRDRAAGLERDGDAALAAFEEAERVGGPSLPLARSRFALLAAQRRLAAALVAADQARRLNPLDDTALYFRASTRARLGQGEGARADFRRALDRRPDSHRVALELAALELGQGRPRAALDAIEDLVRADPRASTADGVREARRAAERALIQEASDASSLASFVRSTEAETRRQLAFALAQRETVESEDVLRRLLEDREPAVRVTTLRMYVRPYFLARVEQDEALAQRVVRMLADDESPHVRAAAAALLKVVERPFAEAALAARLAGPSRDADPYPRAAAAEALGRHGGAGAKRALVTALADEDPTVRRAAVDSLFRLASTDLDYDPDGSPDQRAAACERWEAWLRDNG